jgi:hypothetical protein
LTTLPRSGVAHVTIVVQPTVDGRNVNTATVRAIQPDQARWNNVATLATMVASSSTADVGVSAKAAPCPATVGQPLTYTFTVRNLASVDAPNVVL